MKASIWMPAMLMMTLAGCASVRSFFAADNPEAERKPISDPFGQYYSSAKNDPNETIILRTKKGDRSIEVELPKASQDMTDFVIPVSPAFKESSSRAPASADGVVDDSYKNHAPTYSDREIVSSLPQGALDDETKRHEIEQGLNLIPTEDSAPEQDGSYLAAIDHIKQLYRLGRYEAALIESDTLLKQFQTDPKIYEMRGTLLDRLGKTDLALKSWKQAVRLSPKNQALRRFVERRQQKASATP